VISLSHNFIYIHIPKTAGNSITACLQNYSADEIVWRPSSGHIKNEDGKQGLDVINKSLGGDLRMQKHAKVNDYAQNLGQQISKFKIVVSVRNPYDRIISYTAFSKQEPLPERRLELGELCFPEPMINYVKAKNFMPDLKIIRYENLEDDYNKICGE